MLQKWREHGAITCPGYIIGFPGDTRASILRDIEIIKSVYRQARAILKEVLAVPDRWTYSDLAIAPPRNDEFDRLDLYQATAGGEGALAVSAATTLCEAGLGVTVSIGAAD
jgi:hypothetical protein